MVPPIIFATVAVGIAKMGDMRRVGAVGLRALIYFEVVSTIALVVGLVVGNLWQPGAGLHINPASLDDKAVANYVTSAKSLTIIDFLMKMIPANLVGAVAQGDLLPILVMAILFGFALCQMGERGQRLVAVIDDVMHALFGVVRTVMYVAPPAAFGAHECHVEIREQVESETVGRADRRAFLGPALAGAALDVNLLGGLRWEKVLAKFEKMQHAIQHTVMA